MPGNMAELLLVRSFYRKLKANVFLLSCNNLEACPLKSLIYTLQTSSLWTDFLLFNTSDMNIIRFCQTQFDVHLPSEQWMKRTNKFVSIRNELKCYITKFLCVAHNSRRLTWDVKPYSINFWLGILLLSSLQLCIGYWQTTILYISKGYSLPLYNAYNIPNPILPGRHDT